MLTAKIFSFLVTLLLDVNLTDISKSAYSEAKSPVPGTSLWECLTVYTTASYHTISYDSILNVTWYDISKHMT